MTRLRLMTTALAVAGAAVLGAASFAPETAQAYDPTEYDMCMLNAYYSCFPLDQYGFPTPPDLGNPEVAAAFEACVAYRYSQCSGLPGDPNG